MGILSSTISLVLYKVEGELPKPLMETVGKSLTDNAVYDIDGETLDKCIGWTSFFSPYNPEFEGSSFSIGTHFVFSLRLDKKAIPSKVVKKQFDINSAKRLAETGQEFLTKLEKNTIKEQVVSSLSIKIPATPNIYDVVWDYENSLVYFFTNLKTANEEFETIFSKSFKLRLIRLFPYTYADLNSNLSDEKKDLLSKLENSSFV